MINLERRKLKHKIDHQRAQIKQYHRSIVRSTKLMMKANEEMNLNLQKRKEFVIVRSASNK